MKETPKQKAIRETYGKLWDKVKKDTNKDGWVWAQWDYELPTNIFTDDEIDTEFGFWRPTSLRGIENNNGWIRTDERLPDTFKTVNIYYTIGKTAIQEIAHLKPDGNFYGVDQEAIDEPVTHW